MPETLEIIVQILAVAALLAIIWWKIRPVYRFRKNAVKAEGSIVNWMKSQTKKEVFFYPMIEFRTKGGREIRFKAEERSENKPMFPVGTKVTVAYDPNNPENRKVKYPKPPN